jgi:hypothetical protein
MAIDKYQERTNNKGAWKTYLETPGSTAKLLDIMQEYPCWMKRDRDNVVEWEVAKSLVTDHEEPLPAFLPPLMEKMDDNECLKTSLVADF